MQIFVESFQNADLGVTFVEVTLQGSNFKFHIKFSFGLSVISSGQPQCELHSCCVVCNVFFSFIEINVDALHVLLLSSSSLTQHKAFLM